MHNQTNISNQKLTWPLYGALAFSQLTIIFAFEKVIYKGDLEPVESMVYVFGALALMSHLV